MILRVTIALLCLGLPTVTVASTAPDRAAEIARIEKGLVGPVIVVGDPNSKWTIEERLARYKAPAMSVAVIEGGKVAWAKGYGSVAAGGAPATTKTLFQAASISKPVAAAAALTLVQRGRLGLDRPVNDYLKSWKLPDSEVTAKQPVTLRHLLSHSGSTTVSGFGGYANGVPRPSLQQVLSGTSPANSEAVRVDGLPGEKWRYSGGGTTVMQQMVEDVTGRSFAPAMKELILGPAGMSDSTYEQPLPQKLEALAAVAHAGLTPIDGKWHIYPEQAAAGFWTTPTDLARFAVWVMRGLKDPKAPAEQKAVASLLTEPQGKLSIPSPAGIQKMGLGFFLSGEGKVPSFGHTGANEGYRTFMIAYPETGQGAVIMINSDPSPALTQELLRAIAREYNWPESQPRSLVPAKVPEERLKSLAGTYKWGASPNQQAVVSEQGSRLQAKFGQQAATALVPEDAATFVRIDNGNRVRFEGDTMVLEGSGKPQIAKRIDR